MIGMEFPKGKWVCYSRILFYSSENHKSKQLTSAVVISSGFGTRCAYSCDRRYILMCVCVCDYRVLRLLQVLQFSSTTLAASLNIVLASMTELECFQYMLYGKKELFIIMMSSNDIPFCSGLWGLLCVAVFRNTCLVRELYENLCYCLNSDLPSSV